MVITDTELRMMQLQESASSLAGLRSHTHEHPRVVLANDQAGTFLLKHSPMSPQHCTNQTDTKPEATLACSSFGLLFELWGFKAMIGLLHLQNGDPTPNSADLQPPTPLKLILN